jgi:secreted PhoX family phosphatase
VTPRTLLPLLGAGPHGSRSQMTCYYRCGNACDHPEPNRSANEHVSAVVERVIARRSVLKAGAATTGAMVLGLANPSPAAAATGTARRPGVPTDRQLGAVTFEPVPPNVRDNVTVPAGFDQDVVIRWGDPVVKGAPRFDVHNQTAEAAALQFGYNNDYVGVLPLDGRDRALLVVNHEYTDEALMFPTGRYDDHTVREIAMAAHGMSVVQIERSTKAAGSWRRTNPARAHYNRRVTVSTPFAVTGPAAGTERMRTTADPSGRTVLGTLNNCAGGTTPWGTVLSGEENFNQYFETSGPLDARYTESYARYGISGTGGRGWDSVDERFDMAKHPHEPFRFGWIVEIDPYDPRSTPRKHTMLGRFKHEGANVIIAPNGRAVAYMGDDERGDYIYKFVSRDTFDPGSGQVSKRHNLTLLTHGTLYVARLTDEATDAAPEYDGVGEWIPLASDTESFVPGMTVADVLIDTRLAADKVSPTRMDRPEDVEANPVNGRIYAALTNNSSRGSTFPADEANPVTSSQTRPALGAPLVTRNGNRNGYVLELTENGGDHTATRFAWTLMLVCGDPEAPETYFAGYPKADVSPVSCPDNVAFDGVGNLWISTDGAQLGSHDGLFRVPVEGPERGNVQQFLTVPVGAETCGPLITEDQLSLFIAVQHPGETDGATFENPSSTWPHTDDFPRPGVVVVYKK